MPVTVAHIYTCIPRMCLRPSNSHTQEALAWISKWEKAGGLSANIQPPSHMQARAASLLSRRPGCSASSCGQHSPFPPHSGGKKAGQASPSRVGSSKQHTCLHYKHVPAAIYVYIRIIHAHIQRSISTGIQAHTYRSVYKEGSP